MFLEHEDPLLRRRVRLVGGIAIAVALVGYNNFRPQLGGIRYVAINLAVGAAVGFVAVRFLGATSNDLGLRGNYSCAAAAATATAILLAAPLLVLALFDETAQLVADDRVADLDVSDVAWHALIRIPIGTALVEEFVFRGALFGILADRGFRWSAVVSSIAFGLWHIRPTLDVVHANAPDATALATTVYVVAAVLITGAAGAGFCWLRMRGRGIAAPVGFHAGLNSLSLVAAAIAHRTLG